MWRVKVFQTVFEVVKRAMLPTTVRLTLSTVMGTWMFVPWIEDGLSDVRL